MSGLSAGVRAYHQATGSPVGGMLVQQGGLASSGVHSSTGVTSAATVAVDVASCLSACIRPYHGSMISPLVSLFEASSRGGLFQFSARGGLFQFSARGGLLFHSTALTRLLFQLSRLVVGKAVAEVSKMSAIAATVKKGMEMNCMSESVRDGLEVGWCYQCRAEDDRGRYLYEGVRCVLSNNFLSIFCYLRGCRDSMPLSRKMADEPRRGSLRYTIEAHLLEHHLT